MAHEIGRRIVAGEIAERSLLPREAALAEQFSVSRQAVREALKVLAAKRLLQSRRRTGTSVLPRSCWNLLDPDVLAWHPTVNATSRLLTDLSELRRLIEPEAAELAAVRGTPEHVHAVGRALAAMRAAEGGSRAFHVADAEFHIAIFAASGNEFIDRLSHILGPLLRKSFEIQDEVPAYVISEVILPLHQRAYDAIVARDGAGARAAMMALLANASDKLSVNPRAAAVVADS